MYMIAFLFAKEYYFDWMHCFVHTDKIAFYLSSKWKFESTGMKIIPQNAN